MLWVSYSDLMVAAWWMLMRCIALITWILSSLPQVVNSRRESDAGVYWCEARNEFGVSKSRNATLQVAGELPVPGISFVYSRKHKILIISSRTVQMAPLNVLGVKRV